MSLLARLSWWMHQCGAGVDDISEELLDRFTSAERSRERVCGSVNSAMFAMRRFLTETGYLLVLEGDPAPVTPALNARPRKVLDYATPAATLIEVLHWPLEPTARNRPHEPGTSPHRAISPPRQPIRSAAAPSARQNRQ